MLGMRAVRGTLYGLMFAFVVSLCATSLATITFSNNILTYSSPSDLGTTIDPAGLNDVATSYGVTKASFQALNPQVVGFNGAPAPGTPLNSLVVNYATTGTVTFTFAVSYNYGSYSTYGRGAFSGASLQDAMSTAPSASGGLNDWLDATITTTGGKSVVAIGFCAAFRNDQAVPAGQITYTFSDSTTASTSLPALGGSGNPQYVFIGYQAPAGKIITRVQASRASTVGGAWVAVDDLSFIMADVTPPAAVVNLATGSPTSSSITLSWTAPGDDGNTGTATAYDIRYRTGGAVNDSNWASATQVSGEPTPLVAGTNQNMVITGLSPSTTYYFAIKTSDEVPNTSAISNSPSGTTTAGGDSTPPAAVTNLSCSNLTATSVQLNWTAPGDDGNTGTATTYDIRYSTSVINSGNWASATQVSGEPAPLVAGTNQNMVISGLTADTTYYFAIETADEVPNWSGLSNVPSAHTVDSVSPAAVSNLSCSNLTTTSVQLNWTAPGDNGSSGTATTYDIRYSTSVINSGNWASATQVSGEPAPAAAGTNQNMVISGLTADTTYYFAIETADEVPNWSGLSNVPSAHTVDSVAPAAVNNLATGSPTSSSITLSWTAPGDNGSSGTATTYDIRYSTSTINTGNWSSATQVSGEPTPLVAGSNQNMVISGLSANTTYYFAIETADEVPNWSGLSNVPSGTTTAGGHTWICNNETDVENAMNNYAAGDTISLNAGTYVEQAFIQLNRGAVTFRGSTGNRDDVIIQGPGINTNANPTEGITIGSSNVTVQDLTVKGFYYNGIHVRGENNADNPIIQNVKVLDCGERYIKGSTNTSDGTKIVDNLLIQNCWLEQLTALSGHSDNDYVGGIDMMGLNAPIIRQCVIKNIKGATGGGRGGIFLWNGINNPTVERNQIIGCDRSICMGNPAAPGHSYMPNYHVTGGINRNNFVTRGAGIGMEICFTKNLEIAYNTIYSSNAGYSRTISITDASGNPTVNLQLKYNIIRGLISNTSYGSGNVTETGDITGSTPATTWFVAPDSGDLHLTTSATGALNTGVLLSEVPTDFDNQTRSSTPDVGADEESGY